MKGTGTTGRRFRGVLLDWRGTLVVAPTYRWLVRRGLQALARPDSDDDVEAVLARLRSADATEVGSSAVDADADLHRRVYARWFRAAGLDDELAAALYAVECDVAANPFADDVGPLLSALRGAGVRVGVLSDVHVDLRPAFGAHAIADGTSWADLVDVWTLSFEVGAAKPDPAIFERALRQLGLPAAEVLMVGDRGTHDGAAAACGITTLLLPPLGSPQERRLQRVLDLVLPGAVLPDT
ncbi:haloacid dehalogenase superfamily, subfamily IA, variant 3 with third motif having DD or ED/haloacid dehalogenase superfamily, subfamily IA, variant 1 with third motif having Dx(3-4)D or Dx(3-4)E [Quadrisphaera granulorum]|uniref:HAD superfamily hydrolase (TIGR01509 family)/HAD superfamily hydrolase (TIGR01549 family) n=1 Tax=Quadrisphaera granulorum TaxID=317664 RepID=A0A316A9H5_9ACTN|nr:HAD family hydrolase [Quadrisphaera granulorum]PWJ53650.1 HAD superfamily hydrolase (TIGR01509 family)/HAD superfamily hydrolase (TIGR01549 family) [Quadrisphaera granulorum]SZE96694.1 haloacid dehalogenase superfamily, subfamily IA, variant 3 with third motif having DD or ED/haloacid dehalogenase superfamily, subfamily IA, variant 1 with third motif having Dx(3-4)D or Dx(3-4)E [Quadrisphaera granulorum]